LRARDRKTEPQTGGREKKKKRREAHRRKKGAVNLEAKGGVPKKTQNEGSKVRGGNYLNCPPRGKMGGGKKKRDRIGKRSEANRNLAQARRGRHNTSLGDIEGLLGQNHVCDGGMRKSGPKILGMEILGEPSKKKNDAQI